MPLATLYDDTANGEGDIVEITGDFELQVSGGHGGVVRLRKALGTGSASDDFGTVEAFVGPAHRYITNPNTSNFYVDVSRSNTSVNKKVTYQTSD